MSRIALNIRRSWHLCRKVSWSILQQCALIAPTIVTTMAGIIDWTTVAPVIALGWRYVGAGALHSVVVGVRHSYSQARAALLKIYAPSFYATEK
jgi:hypothetical protein